MLQARPLPQETIDALRPPARGFPYFEHADTYRFDPFAKEISPINAWWLADASLVVYGDAAFVQDAFQRSPLPKMGFQLDWLGTPKTNRGIVLSSDDAVVVIFRGTRVESQTIYGGAELLRVNREDFWTDSQFLLTSCPLSGKVHQGFLTAYRQVHDRVESIVQSRTAGQKLWLAGHSLGGALAAIAAAYIGPDRIDGLYTYGSPRVGNAEFVRLLPKHNYYRFVHRSDWGATVPPEMLGYVHGGTVHSVRGSRPRSLMSDIASHADALATALARVAKEFRLKVGDLPSAIASIADHAPIYYATLLWNALIEDRPTEKRE